MVFHHLPEHIRLDVVRRALGPSGGWFIRDKVVGKVSLSLGYTPEFCEPENGRVRLQLRGKDGSQQELVAEHVIAATGYRVAIDRLKFLNADIRAQVRTINGSPALSSTFESSVPGLYFIGVSAANSFGPVMRFAFGAGFAARTVTRTLAKRLVRRSSASVPLAHSEKGIGMTD
jgi:thioredoxin reductase